MYDPRISPFDANLMFVACDMTGLYRSVDRGLSWSLLDTRRVQGSNRFGVAFDPARDGHVVGAHPMLGLMESIDWGVSWTPFAPALPALPLGVRVTAAAFSPEAQPRLLVGTTQGVYRIDGGAWKETLPDPNGADQQVKDSQQNVIATVNDNDVIGFAFVKDPAAGGAVVDLVATVRDGFSWNPGTNAWDPFGPPQPTRPAGPFNAYQDFNTSPPGYLASRVRGLAAGFSGARYVVYVSILTDASDIGAAGGVYRLEQTATNNPVWAREPNGLILTTGDQRDSPAA